MHSERSQSGYLFTECSESGLCTESNHRAPPPASEAAAHTALLDELDDPTLDDFIEDNPAQKNRPDDAPRSK